MVDFSRTGAVNGRPVLLALISSMCLTLVACGGANYGTIDVSDKRSADVPGVATQVRLPDSSPPVAASLDRSTDLRGPDTNNNGVRDDIDAFVSALPLTGPQKKAAMQRARNQQSKLLVDPLDKSAVQNLSVGSMAATKCMGDVFEGQDARRADELQLRIEAITANTPERALRYIRFMAALSGTSVEYPSGNTCEE